MRTNFNLQIDPYSKKRDQKVYCSMIGSCFTFGHLEHILCLVWLCVKEISPDFDLKPHLVVVSGGSRIFVKGMPHQNFGLHNFIINIGKK
jgi:hypothetical protein